MVLSDKNPSMQKVKTWGVMAFISDDERMALMTASESIARDAINELNSTVKRYLSNMVQHTVEERRANGMRYYIIIYPNELASRDYRLWIEYRESNASEVS